MAPGRQACGTGVRLVRQARVVECHGEPVVRFLPDCGMAGAGCGCCGAFQRDRQIPLSWLAAGGEPRVGESITVEVPSAALTRVAAVLFAVPLAALLAGAWLGRLAGGAAPGADLTSGIAGLVCLGSSLLVVARYGAAMAGMLRLTAHRQRMDS